MNDHHGTLRYELTRSRILSLPTAGGLTIACDRGLVWVTAAGQLDDYWVPSGESLSIARGGRVVIEAAQSSAITVTRVARKPLAAMLAASAAFVRDAIARWMRRPGGRGEARRLCTNART